MLTLGVAACTSADDATGGNEISSGTDVTTVEDTGAEPLESSDESAVEVPAFGDANAENHFVGNDANSDDLLENGLSDDDALDNDEDDSLDDDDDLNDDGDDDSLDDDDDDDLSDDDDDGSLDDDDSGDGGDDAGNSNESDDDENSEDGEKDDGGD